MDENQLLEAVEPLLLDFVSRAELKGHKEGESSPEAIPRPGALVDYVEPRDLIKRLNFALPSTGRGQDGVTDVLERILKNSVNTWHQGFMDKLYASTNAVGVVSELILATLNTNVRCPVVHECIPCSLSVAFLAPCIQSLASSDRHREIRGEGIGFVIRHERPLRGWHYTTRRLSVQPHSAGNCTKLCFPRNQITGMCWEKTRAFHKRPWPLFL